MESEVVYYLYTFEVKVGNKYKKFYFENKEDAAIARFSAYCTFDYERLTINGFVPPVSQPARVMFRKNELEKIEVLPSYEDFVRIWYGKDEPETEANKSSKDEKEQA